MQWHKSTNKRYWDNTKYSEKLVSKVPKIKKSDRLSYQRNIIVHTLLLFVFSGSLQSLTGHPHVNSPEFYTGPKLVIFGLITAVAWFAADWVQRAMRSQ